MANTKSYRVRWVGKFKDEWCDPEDVDEEAVDAYWEALEERKRKKTSGRKRTSRDDDWD